jgi:haloalkane dehalogenase
MINTVPYATLQHRAIAGKTMAYIDDGEGDAIVFQHGNPTSSYLWRNVMPHLAGLGRLIACDLIGMGGSDKLSPSGPDSYHFAEQRDYLFALWDELDLGDRVVLVLDDWGSALGFDWANQHRDRVQGIAYMEAIVTPLQWSDVPPDKQPTFRALRSPAGEELILEQNAFVETVLPGSILRGLSDAEMNHYRCPFRNAGEDRRAQAVHQRRSRHPYQRPSTSLRQDMAEPNRNDSRRNPLRPRGQPRPGRHGHRRLRAAPTHFPRK